VAGRATNFCRAHEGQGRANFTHYESMKPLELLHQVLKRLPSQPNGWVTCTRSELTRALCHHPNRPGSVTTADLDRLVPLLVASGLASEICRPGKPPAYAFRPVTGGERNERHCELVSLRIKFWDANPGAERRRDMGNPAWLEEQRLVETVGPHGGSPADYKPLKHLATICSTDRPKNKTDVPVPTLSPPQTP
jgi:hypothetical protein